MNNKKESLLSHMGQSQPKGTLDGFFGAGAPPPKPPEKRCANPKCRKILKGRFITIEKKGKKLDYCPECTRPHLKRRSKPEVRS